MNTLKVSGHLLILCILTIATQIGGLVYGLSLVCTQLLNIQSTKKRILYRTLSFIGLYLLFTLLLVPLIARPFGRVPLPILKTRNLKPATILTCLLNRHYVKEELKESTLKIADQLNQNFPGALVIYLDANFPFIDNFPLLPHRSHHDGKKLDLSFQYDEIKSGRQTNNLPSFLGYGICEEPKASEENTAEFCSAKGYWQYSILRDVTPQSKKKHFAFNEERTRFIINAYASEQAIEKIFIEPHLKQRLRISNNKVRFHGCQAVRHNDHIHVQMK